MKTPARLRSLLLTLPLAAPVFFALPGCGEDNASTPPASEASKKSEASYEAEIAKSKEAMKPAAAPGPAPAPAK
ncbi:MAG: hypothetical protein U0835_14210 [Isosphaeraceae bacterium]